MLLILYKRKRRALRRLNDSPQIIVIAGEKSWVPAVVGSPWVSVRRLRHLQQLRLSLGHQPASPSARRQQAQIAPLHSPQRLAGRTRHHWQHRGEHRGESQVAVDCVKRFAASSWCQFELTMAQTRLFEEDRDNLILVLLEEIAEVFTSCWFLAYQLFDGYVRNDWMKIRMMKTLRCVKSCLLFNVSLIVN